MTYFSTFGFARQKQVAAWQEIMSDVYYSLEINGTSSDGLRGTIHQFDIGHLSITNFDADAQRVFRTRPRIARDPEDAFVFVAPFREVLYFSQMGRSGFVHPGGYALVSTSEFYELSCPDNFENWTVKIPGEDLRRRIPNIEDYCACRMPNNPAMASIARNHLRSVAMARKAGPLPNERAVAQNLVDTIVLTLDSEANWDGAKLAAYRVRGRILEYIRGNIHDMNLSPASIAEANGVSVSYIYKLFRNGDLTVGEYILAQRLQAAYEYLAVPGRSGMTVAEAAYAAGFRNLSHFSRVFREKYGLSPSAVRRRPT